MVSFDEIFLTQAIHKAWETQTLALPNPSVGALILSKNNQILALSTHSQSGRPHAELEAVKQAFLKLHSMDCNALNHLSTQELYDFLITHHQGIFEDCSFYVTLEPCAHEGKTPSCAKLLSSLKPKKVIFGARDSNPIAQGGAKLLESQGIEVIGGVCEKESLDLIYPFLQLRRTGHFNLFKLAQHLNGNYKGGQITHLGTKTFTHTQRSVADSLIISGNTLKNDRPKLDIRFANPNYTHAPIIKIFSRSHTHDLSCINASEIQICHSQEALSLHQGFNIIEGGYPLLEALQDQVDCVLLLLSTSLSGEGAPTQALNFTLLHTQTFCHDTKKDIALWLKP